MVVPKEEKDQLVYDIKISSVYIKGLYFFPNNKTTNNNKNDSNDNDNLISVVQLKKAMFESLVSYFITCGRICFTSDPEPQPVIKLNDAGARIIEARSAKTVHEWLTMEGFPSLQDQLVYGPALGPNLGFSPLVFIQPRNSRNRAKIEQRFLAFFFPSVTLSLSSFLLIKSSAVHIVPIIISFNVTVTRNNGG
ncbi:hypothetical protein Cgig2_033651 [Carnegiea gigantea]|uniref:Uncharacterized protein n=1 Tax=Carnegiea gigantea TaxID=171969 RepID=A0A9Q1GPQ7_9CARY|nr:hypothetical protein Cgig2_033651 [Carnegiea gigantea]